MSEAVVILDHDNHIVQYNPSFVRLLDHAQRQRLETPVKMSDLFTGLDTIDWLDCRSNEKFYKIGAADKKPAHISVLTHIVEIDGNAYFWVSMRNVTALILKHQRDIQAEKMRAIGAISNTIAVKFNRILNAISVNVRAIQDLEKRFNLPDQLLMRLDMLEATAHRSMGQLSRLLMAMPAKEHMQISDPDNKIENINLFLQDMRPMVEMSLNTSISLQYDLSSIPAYANINRSQLESALINMAANAAESMPNGGSLSIKTQNIYVDENMALLSPDLHEGDYTCLSLADTGCGMDDLVQQRIFEPYFSTKSSGRGPGLGMSVVYGVVQRLNGYIHVYSEEGCGSVFKIYIPKAQDTNVANFPERVEVTSLSSQTIAKTVLVVDDHDLMRGMAVETFRRLGFSVLSASNKYEAIEMLKLYHDKVDLLFLDVFLGNDMSGFDLANILAEYVSVDTCTLYTSGYDLKHLSAMHDMSDKRFLAKPFANHELQEHIQQMWP